MNIRNHLKYIRDRAGLQIYIDTIHHTPTAANNPSGLTETDKRGINKGTDSSVFVAEL